MSDYLLGIGQNPLARKLVRRLNLPIPLPESLHRASGPWTVEPFAGRKFAIGGLHARDPLVHCMQRLVETGGGKLLSLAEARDVALNGLIFDATGLTSAKSLAALFDFFQPRLRQLSAVGRIIVIGLEPCATKDSQAAATQAGLVGFIKSLAKEVGRKGSTAQLITLDASLINGKDQIDDQRREDALRAPVNFFLSTRSAYISGQIIALKGIVEAPSDAPLLTTQTLSGKKAVVTGAAQGIGRAIAERLAQEGAEVLCVDHPIQTQALSDAVASLAIPGHAFALDLAHPAAADELAAYVEREWNRVDILVNNAGITRDKTLARMSRDAWDQAINLNLGATIAITEALIGSDDALIRLLQAKGRIICLASISGIAGNSGQTNYATAKAGIIGYVRQLATRLAGRGITVNALAPGFIETPMTHAMPIAIRELARRFNALNQGGLPQDVAEACVFLASPGGYALTGEPLRVCGLNHLGA